MKSQHYIDDLFKSRLGNYASSVPKGSFEEILNARATQRSGQKGNRIFLLLLLLPLFIGAGYLFNPGLFTITPQNSSEGATPGNFTPSNPQLKSVAPLPLKGALEEDLANNSGTKNNLSVAVKDYEVSDSDNSSFPREKEIASPQKAALPLSEEESPVVGLTTDDAEMNNDKEPLSQTTVLDRAKWSSTLALLPKQMNSLESDAGNDESQEELFKVELSKTDKDCYDFRKKPSEFSIDAYFSPEYSIRNLSAKNAESVDYTSEREKTENFRYAFSGGLRVSIQTPGGIAFRTGLEYNQISEKFSFLNSRSTTITIDTFFNADGSISWLDTTVVTGTRIKTTHNRFHMIDVPLILGYEITGNRWSIDINGGAYVNLIFRKKGDFLSPALNPVNFSSSNSNPYPAFNDKVGFSLFGSIAFKYGLTDRIQLLIEPRVKYYLNSFTINSYPLDQEYLTTGIITGLRYKF